jgi:uncharacterized protein with FMN-binding domain
MTDEELILPEKWRKVLSIIHQILVGVLFLSALYIIVLLIIRSSVEGAKLKSLDITVYRTVNSVFSWSFYAVIATAFIFAVFTKWGFFKFRWIIVKWILSGVLFCMTMFFVYPAVSGIVAIRSGGFSINGAREEYTGLSGTAVRWLILEAVFFVGMIIISTMKPWGVRKKDTGLKRQTVLILAATGIFIGLLFLAANFFNLQRIRNMTINEPDLKGLENGRYIGRAEVGGFSYVVEAIMTDHRIEEIKVLKNRNSSYARWAEGVISKILKHQTLKVDAVTGATTTSKAIMKAVSNSLQSEK